MAALSKDQDPTWKYKVALLGDYGVGKKSLLRRLKDNTFDEYDEYQQDIDSCTKVVKIDGETVMLSIWLWSKYEQLELDLLSPYVYRNIDVFVLVYSVSDTLESQNLDLWIQKAERYDKVHIIIGNKIDVGEDEILVSRGALKSFVEAWDFELQLLTSCKTNSCTVLCPDPVYCDIGQAFELLAKILHKSRQGSPGTDSIIREWRHGGRQATGVETKGSLGERLWKRMKKPQLHSPDKALSKKKAGMAEERVRRLEEEKQAAETRKRAEDAEREIADLRMKVEEAERRARDSERTTTDLIRQTADANQRMREAETRARESTKAIAQAEQRATQSDQRAAQSDQRAAQAEQRATQSDQRAAQAEQRATQAEQRATQAEAGAHFFQQQIEQLLLRVREAEQMAREARERVRPTEQRVEMRGHDQFWVVNREEIQLTDQELGRGGWAVVRVAKFRGLRVAAKCLHNLIVSDYNRQLFVREMSIAARVRHPNLVQFIGAMMEGEPIILTELMATSLRAVLERRPSNPAQTTSISLDVARALNYLHLMHPDPIIHRDISSANVLLESGPNNSWRAKVSDYGSANFLQQLRTAGPGNPTYAAPEADIPSQQSPKMDVYSYGVLLLEMCSRRFPNPEESEALLQRVQQPAMVALIRQCMERAPMRRPTMSDIIGQLE